MRRMVQATVPPERLLVLGPLCKFLGKEVPDEPFLFVNETEDLNKARKVMVFVSYAWLPGALAVTAVVARVCLSRLGR